MKYFNKVRLRVKCFLRKYKLMNQFCKRCGKTNKSFDFSVSDEVWEKLPKKYHNHILCLHCFLEEYYKEYPECKGEVDVRLYWW